MDYRDRHVVVTGGTGALGHAVVGALVAAGAVCHVPHLVAAEAERFPLRDHAKVKLVAGIDLTDEAAVARLYDGVPSLWASIHLAGGFAMTAIGKTTKADLMKQIDLNLVTAFLSCRAAVNAMTRTGAGGRIVNVAARPGLEWRSGAGMTAYTASKAAVANRAAMPQADYAAWPKTEEVAATILFLASPDNKVTRGSVVPVYGRS
jgi:NAD(P)-dependent dehydrogenase (short-subunit alcohol dehydrogenase family)